MMLYPKFWFSSVLVVENHIQSEDVPQFFLEFALELNLSFNAQGVPESTRFLQPFILYLEDFVGTEVFISAQNGFQLSLSPVVRIGSKTDLVTVDGFKFYPVLQNGKVIFIIWWPLVSLNPLLQVGVPVG